MSAEIMHNQSRTKVSRRHVLAMFAAGTGAAFLAACGGTSATIPAVATAAPTTPATMTQARASSPATGTAPTVASGTAATAGQDNMPLLTIEAVEYGFRTNGSVPAGMTMVQMKNLGQEDHQAQFLRLNDGVTLPQVQAALRTDQQTVTTLTTLVGGPGTVAGGGTSAAMMDLREGQYLLVCFIPGADHIPHAAKGMVLPLQVTAQSGAAVPAPATQGMIIMKDFSFALSTSTLPAGKSLIAVSNEGAQPHEFGVIRLAPGKTAGDVTGYFAAPPAGPPPFASAGGMTALSPGQRGIAALDLTPGNYVMICFVPDPASGKSHLQLGMIAGLTVA